MLSRILVPLDGRPEMAAALPAIRQLVSVTGTNVHLLLVRPMPRQVERRGDGWAYLDELVREECADGQAYLCHHGSALAYDGIVVQREVRFGELLPQILAAATRQAAHLIALAAPAPSWGERLLGQRWVQQLMARAPVPVLVIPPSGTPAPGVRLQYGRLPV